jgi:hypothetical protein
VTQSGSLTLAVPHRNKRSIRGRNRERDPVGVTAVSLPDKQAPLVSVGFATMDSINCELKIFRKNCVCIKHV